MNTKQQSGGIAPGCSAGACLAERRGRCLRRGSAGATGGRLQDISARRLSTRAVNAAGIGRRSKAQIKAYCRPSGRRFIVRFASHETSGKSCTSPGRYRDGSYASVDTATTGDPTHADAPPDHSTCQPWQLLMLALGPLLPSLVRAAEALSTADSFHRRDAAVIGLGASRT